jgi:hypothetical protein
MNKKIPAIRIILGAIFPVFLYSVGVAVFLVISGGADRND